MRKKCKNTNTRLHINKPFEVCLSPVLLNPSADGPQSEIKEKVGR
jgi:hypothetical protein